MMIRFMIRNYTKDDKTVLLHALNQIKFDECDGRQCHECPVRKVCSDIGQAERWLEADINRTEAPQE